jgi:hypothetical protein
MDPALRTWSKPTASSGMGRITHESSSTPAISSAASETKLGTE